MAAQHGVSDAVNEPGVFPYEAFEDCVSRRDCPDLGVDSIELAAISRDAVQGRLSRHHSSALKHEDRPER
jgi:hypothetical protein